MVSFFLSLITSIQERGITSKLMEWAKSYLWRMKTVTIWSFCGWRPWALASISDDSPQLLLVEHSLGSFWGSQQQSPSMCWDHTSTSAQASCSSAAPLPSTVVIPFRIEPLQAATPLLPPPLSSLFRVSRWFTDTWLGLHHDLLREFTDSSETPEVVPFLLPAHLCPWAWPHRALW